MCKFCDTDNAGIRGGDSGRTSPCKRCSAAHPLHCLLFSSPLVWSRSWSSHDSRRDVSSKFKLKVPLVELWAELCCFSLCLPPLHPLPETLSLYFLFDILVPCFFSYCCPTLVVRWTVLLPQTLNRWTGLHYQRWVSVSSALWRFPTFACSPDGWTPQSYWSTWWQSYSQY